MSHSQLPYLSDEAWTALPMRERALQVAALECDRYKVREVGRNDGPKVREYLRSAGVTVPANWCASFVTWATLKAGVLRDNLPSNPASCCTWLRTWATPRGHAHQDAAKVRRGDLFVWCNQPKSWTGHIGFVIKIVKIGPVAWMKTIEGNTDGDNAAGIDGVYRRTRMVRKNIWFMAVPW